MDLERLITLIGIPREKVLNVYLSGSRVFGTIEGDSDWDFTIVVSDDAPLQGGKEPGEGRAGVDGVFDASIYTETRFKEHLTHYLPLIQCLSLPPESIWKETRDFKADFRLDLSALRIAVSTISSQGFGYAKICWEKNHDIRKAKKNIVHSIRNVMYGIQLARDGRINDLRCAVELYKEVIQDQAMEWSHYQEKYGALGKELHKQFLALVPAKPPSARELEKRAKTKRLRQQQNHKASRKDGQPE